MGGPLNIFLRRRVVFQRALCVRVLSILDSLEQTQTHNGHNYPQQTWGAISERSLPLRLLLFSRRGDTVPSFKESDMLWVKWKRGSSTECIQRQSRNWTHILQANPSVKKLWKTLNIALSSQCVLYGLVCSHYSKPVKLLGHLLIYLTK